ncbi:hypothetical protein ABFX02_05G013700 [Erythranthe guttata]
MAVIRFIVPYLACIFLLTSLVAAQMGAPAPSPWLWARRHHMAPGPSPHHHHHMAPGPSPEEGHHHHHPMAPGPAPGAAGGRNNTAPPPGASAAVSYPPSAVVGLIALVVPFLGEIVKRIY